jgi:hypothetical protein
LLFIPELPASVFRHRRKPVGRGSPAPAKPELLSKEPCVVLCQKFLNKLSRIRPLSVNFR